MKEGTSTRVERTERMEEEEEEDLLAQAMDYALAHGLVVRTTTTTTTVPGSSNSSITHAPFALYPSPFPRALYERALQLQPLFNRLVHAVSQDAAFLASVFPALGRVDAFIGALYDLYLRVQQEGVLQPHTLGIHRSDYLLHATSAAVDDGDGLLTIKQVEINTIASSFSSLSARTSDLHRYLWERTQFAGRVVVQGGDSLPPNASGNSVADGLARGWKAYGSAGAVVVMVVQPGETNALDQRHIEHALWSRSHVPLVRATLRELHAHASLQGPERRLWYRGQEVAVVYFRAGYTPRDYPTSFEWEARERVERSYAIKCPSIAHHLVGSKKVQQILAEPGRLERYLPTASHASLVRTCFTGLYPLDGTPAGLVAMEAALSNPDRYVMKPQREGGGNNFYGADIVTQLRTLSAEERNAYILMDLISAPTRRNVLVRQGERIPCDVVSELGIYGIWLSRRRQPGAQDEEAGSGPEKDETILLNEPGGHLLRTKAATSHEGGVAAGFAVLDSPALY